MNMSEDGKRNLADVDHPAVPTKSELIGELLRLRREMPVEALNEYDRRYPGAIRQVRAAPCR